jgi:hypothetical protein
MHQVIQSVGTAVGPMDQDSLHTATKNDASKTSATDCEPLAFVDKSKEVSRPDVTLSAVSLCCIDVFRRINLYKQLRGQFCITLALMYLLILLLLNMEVCYYCDNCT